MKRHCEKVSHNTEQNGWRYKERKKKENNASDILNEEYMRTSEDGMYFMKHVEEFNLVQPALQLEEN